jgi:hypothetical protein
MAEGERGGMCRGVTASSRYQSWLLRCWVGAGSGEQAGATRRYSLEDPHTGARRGFASLADLMAYLRSELEPGGMEPGDGES